jgi:hypothetical protein
MRQSSAGVAEVAEVTAEVAVGVEVLVEVEITAAVASLRAIPLPGDDAESAEGDAATQPLLLLRSRCRWKRATFSAASADDGAFDSTAAAAAAAADSSSEGGSDTAAVAALALLLAPPDLADERIDGADCELCKMSRCAASKIAAEKPDRHKNSFEM